MENAVGGSDIGELVQFAVQTIEEMGDESLKFYGRGRRRPPFDQDLVTQAELHLSESFSNRIGSRFPRHQIYGREMVDEGYTHGADRFLWVFDPLDGVDNFQTGIPIWGMSLALYENHWPVLGVFFMPVTRDLFCASADGPAYWNDRPIRIADRGEFSQESLFLTYSRFHQHYQCRYPGKIRCFGSTGAHCCYVAMGRAEAAVTASETFKDLAAVRVIVESAGGRLYKRDGSDFFLGDYVDGRRIDGRASAESMLECLKPS